MNVLYCMNVTTKYETEKDKVNKKEWQQPTNDQPKTSLIIFPIMRLDKSNAYKKKITNRQIDNQGE
jgi:hypothetical protein